ncbi:UDP-N-acetyl-D-mannosamine dehydrogenase [Campylobacter sp. RM12651]|uniref:UDP-N-acetyl-D-mannosamine dehydrogenase n=1 Tax=Campylobacter sp. RM12651 TaxID=1660079 RepID=UPI001EFB4D8B|nr:UDP-N-acetyl-D-mannosamine dehydrogenase [Campylobacter sp. RM12651]ULO03517.1 UDP-N-acetyl-D-mannosamine dehydrogenase [Campylobacter sp. RM12651]
MKICVIGLGYIGLPTAAMFAKNTNNFILGIDINKNVVDTINKGKIHIVEPGLEEIVKEVILNNKLKASMEIEEADVFIICVPTPFDNEQLKPITDYIKSAVSEIAKVIKKNDLVILESTSPIGTTEKISKWIQELRPDLVCPHTNENSDVYIAHCPERVIPGYVLKEIINNDRIIGGLTNKSTDKTIELYKQLVKGECIPTNAKTAEMSKLVENASRDVQIAFANELSMICDDFGINIWELISLANKHPRVNILNPGCGVGGHCIAVDPWFIVNAAPLKSKLIKTARDINNYKTDYVIEQIIQQANKLNTKQITCLGLAFKPDIDDLRESPAVKIVEKLFSLGYELKAVEPNIEKLPEKLQDKCQLIKIDELDDTFKVILVAHKEFRLIKNKLKSNCLSYCSI